jgi:hypothetical protein
MKRANPIPAVAGRGRSIFEAVKGQYAGKYAPSRQQSNGIVITQSYLRLESAVLSTQGTIDFAVLVNEIAPGASTTNATEKRLALTDNFVCTELGIFIAKYASGSTLAASPLDTFPNSLVYSGSGEAANLRNIYNGYLNVQINGDTILDSWDVNRHYRVGNAQKSVLTAASGTGNAWDASTFDSASYGFFPVTPQIEFRGNAKNKLRINLPSSVALAGTSSSNVCVLVMRGLLVQNGSAIAQG